MQMLCRAAECLTLVDYPWARTPPHFSRAMLDEPRPDQVRAERGDLDMRAMLMIKGDPEPGARPSVELLAAMGRYNDELKQAGVLVDLAGLYPSGEGKRVRYSSGERSVLEGPFGEKDAVAGYWILQVESMDEAVDWANRAPFEELARIYPGEYGAVGEIEIRQVFEMDGLESSIANDEDTG